MLLRSTKIKRGFTLAEVLITLAVIGIVAAITLPSLLVNVNEKAWEAQRKALHARMAQALGQMSTLGGYGTYALGGDDGTTVTADDTAENFIINGLAKVYKINNTCDNENLTACGIPSTFTKLGGSGEMNFPTTLGELNSMLVGSYTDSSDTVYNTSANGGVIHNTKAAAFETANGESVAVFYNPFCGSDSTANHYVQNKMCVNLVYDVNGITGPNEMGRDMGFITAFYRRSPSVVSPLPYTTNAGTGKQTDAAALCKAQDEEARLPDRDELAAMFINKDLLGMSGRFWSGSVVSSGASGLAWYQAFHFGTRGRHTRSTSRSVRCVRK